MKACVPVTVFPPVPALSVMTGGTALPPVWPGCCTGTDGLPVTGCAASPAPTCTYWLNT